MKLKTYTELSQLSDFDDRFNYLKLDGVLGAETFGRDRYLNQALYNSREWRRTRDIVITRDLGCDLGVPGLEILGKVIIHHMNPITLEQITDRDPIVFDPEYLISVSMNTHNALHYANDPHDKDPIVRRKFDTCPWR